jgi:hypothetical protein
MFLLFAVLVTDAGRLLVAIARRITANGVVDARRTFIAPVAATSIAAVVSCLASSR